MEDCELCNFADDTSIFECDEDLNRLISKLEISADVAINWFKMNYFKLNTDKCKVIICGRKSHPITLRVGIPLW